MRPPTGADVLTAARKEARAELWRRREVWPLLEVYLDRDQFADARSVFAGVDIQAGCLPDGDFVLDISRQRGKSWFCCTIASVLCHCLPGFLVNYAAQEQKSVRQIVAPTLASILEDCPPELRPRFDSQDNVWKWENASRIRAFGCNNKQYVAGRGPRAHLNVEDECGFYDEYDAVQAVLAPQLQTTRGFSLFASSPPETPSHPHSAVAMAHKAKGRYSHRTIYNHPRMTEAEIERFLTKEAEKKGQTLAAFKRSTYYCREFLALHVVEEKRAVIPEWSTPPDEEGSPEGLTLADRLVREVPRPRLYDTYTSADFGFTRHPSAILFAWWDFENARLVVEDETPPLYKTRTDALALEYRKKCRELWPVTGPRPYLEAMPAPPDVDAKTGEVRDPGEFWLPWRALGDKGGRGAEVLLELGKEHALHWTGAVKETDLEVMVNDTRRLVGMGKLVVNPRCQHLITQLATGLWADRRKADFAEDSTGHLDHLAALIYLVRAVDRQRNPYPVGFGADLGNQVVVGYDSPRGGARVLEDVFR